MIGRYALVYWGEGSPAKARRLELVEREWIVAETTGFIGDDGRPKIEVVGYLMRRDYDDARMPIEIEDEVYLWPVGIKPIKTEVEHIRRRQRGLKDPRANYKPISRFRRKHK